MVLESKKYVARHLSEALDKPVKYIPGSADAAEQGMKMAGIPEWNARALSELQRMFANGDFAAVHDDLKTLLGTEPRTFADFANDFVKQF